MLRKLLPVIVVNALLIILYVFFNYAVWDYSKSTTEVVQLVSFSPFWISALPLGGLVNGQIIPINRMNPKSFNFPFWLFFVAIAVNLFFIAKLAKDKTI